MGSHAGDNAALAAVPFRSWRVLSIGIASVVAIVAARFIRADALAGAVTLQDTPIKLARCKPLGEVLVRVQVVNRSPHPARIFGGGTSCGCLTITHLPVVVPPKEKTELLLLLHAPASPGSVNEKFVYYIEHSNQYEVLGEIHGEVIARDANQPNSEISGRI